MKREISQPEWDNANNAAFDYANKRYELRHEVDTPELRTAYRCGYLAALGQSVPMELVEEMEQALKDCKAAIEWFSGHMDFDNGAVLTYGLNNRRAFDTDVFHNAMNPIEQIKSVLTKLHELKTPTTNEQA